MSAIIKPAPVRKSLTVKATPQRAFEVFTARFDAWWPRSHSIGASPLKTALIEPGAGGRWLGIGEDGSTDLWGDVLIWDPPGRLVLAWRIGADWKYDPNLLTEVELTFAAEGDGVTRVNFEHRLLENMGAAGEGARAQFEAPSGWGAILDLFRQAVG
jgi:uncharacterized protein YndB with AHSA1/START domain